MLKLCLRLGRTRRELASVLGMDELREWAAFDLICPLGDERHDLLAAVISTAIYRSQGAKTNVHEMMPDWASRAKGEETREEKARRIMGEVEGLAHG